MTKHITLLVFILGFLILIYFNRPSGIEQKEQSKDRLYQDSIQAIRDEFSQRIQLDSIESIELRIKLSHADNALKEALLELKKYKNEKTNHRHFSDPARDSLVARIKN